MLEKNYASVEHMTWLVKDMVTNPESQLSYLYLVIPVLELQNYCTMHVFIYPTDGLVCSWQKYTDTPTQGADWHLIK